MVMDEGAGVSEPIITKMRKCWYLISTNVINLKFYTIVVFILIYKRKMKMRAYKYIHLNNLAIVIYNESSSIRNTSHQLRVNHGFSPILLRLGLFISI